MPRKSHTEEQIIAAQNEAGGKTADICRELSRPGNRSDINRVPHHE
jgi:hypothetical protein